MIASRIPFSFAKKHGVFLTIDGAGCLILSHRAHVASDIIQEIRRSFNKPIQLKLVDDSQFSRLLAQAYETDTSTALEELNNVESSLDLKSLIAELPATEDLLESEDDAPVIKLINAVLTEAINRRASDIHIEIFEARLMVRFRIDGLLHEILEPPRLLAPLFISRLKVMAKLDIAEKRLPQDGRIALRIGGRAIDVRVSTIPTHYGERVVLRLLDKETVPLDLSKLGMSKQTLAHMYELIRRPHGILLVTGPTGSGKTTTLYATLTELNNSSRNILTIEDPIEYYLPGVGQTQVNSKIGMTFSRGLRAILRQDPDVVMVGEIRDLETAQMAIRASLTGHLVLSTLHTNSAVGAIMRLKDMQAESFLVASSLIGICAQRLVRVLCDHCKQSDMANDVEKRLMMVGILESCRVFRPVGCEQCAGTGFRGRTGIYELILIDDHVKQMFHDEVSEQALTDYAHQKVMSIRQSGWECVMAGHTTIEEILRVCV